MKINQAILKALALAGMNKTELAAALGVSHQMLSPYFSGAKQPGAGMIERISRATGCTIGHEPNRSGWCVSRQA